VARVEGQEAIWYGDALCFVLATDRLAEMVVQLLEHYVPDHLPLTEDYEDWGVEYATEYAMLQYLELHPQLSATRYWSSVKERADNVMMGAHFLPDGQLVLSLTVAGNGILEEKLFHELKQLLQSEMGLMSYNYFPWFKSGAEFKALCDSL